MIVCVYVSVSKNKATGLLYTKAVIVATRRTPSCVQFCLPNQTLVNNPILSSAGRQRPRGSGR